MKKVLFLKFRQLISGNYRIVEFYTYKKENLDIFSDENPADILAGRNKFEKAIDLLLSQNREIKVNKTFLKSKKGIINAINKKYYAE